MILIGNGKLITRDSSAPYYENGAVVIDKNIIADCGSLCDLKEKYPNAECMDAKGMVIMPGMINTHHHIYSAFARGLSIPGNKPKDFYTILDGTWWKIDRNLALEESYYSGIATFMECIKNGVTSVIDHHASYYQIEDSLMKIHEAAEQTGIRSVLAYEISDRDGEDKMKQAVKENMSYIESCNAKKDDMHHGLVGLHASFTLSDKTLDYVANMNKSNAGYHVHVAEGELDAELNKSRYKKSIVERFNQFGMLGKNTIAAHCIHIDDSDMDILKDNNTMMVHNPESNMGNAVGCPDLWKLMDKGVLCGLGTDGYTNDMLESIKTANILQKHIHKNPERGFDESIECMFNGNVQIMNRILTNNTGIIRKGYYADIILVDYKPYTPMNEKNYNGHILFGMSGSMTDTTIIDGKIIMKNRELLKLNEEKLLAECRENAMHLWRRLGVK